MKAILLVAFIATTLFFTSCDVNEQSTHVNTDPSTDTTSVLFEYSSFSDMDVYSTGDTVFGVYYKVYSNGKLETLKSIYSNTGVKHSIVASDMLKLSTIDSLVSIVHSSNFLSYPTIVPAFLTSNYNRDSISIIRSQSGGITFSYSKNQTLGIQTAFVKNVRWTDGAEKQYYPVGFDALRGAIIILLSPHSSYRGRY